jgi:hypothetical protein
VGQEWNYIKKNIFDGKILDVINERVASIGSTIVIDRMTTDGARLPSEIQTSWGMVATDTQWSRLINFSPSLPLWPEQLSTTWAKQFNAKYSIAGYPGSKMNWQEYMSVQGWEKITVPAGEFIALIGKYASLINIIDRFTDELIESVNNTKNTTLQNLQIDIIELCKYYKNEKLEIIKK